MSYPNRGGKIKPDGRPVSAPGVGKNSRRHDLETRTTPYLHDSDLQQGDVQAMEQGQRIAPKKTQQPAAPAPVSRGSGTTADRSGTGTTGVPDAIDFLAGRSNGEVGIPATGYVAGSSRATTWLPILQQLATGPGSSGVLGAALIDQTRRMRRAVPRRDAAVIDMQDTDVALAAMLDAGV